MCGARDGLRAPCPRCRALLLTRRPRLLLPSHRQALLCLPSGTERLRAALSLLSARAGAPLVCAACGGLMARKRDVVR